MSRRNIHLCRSGKTQDYLEREINMQYNSMCREYKNPQRVTPLMTEGPPIIFNGLSLFPISYTVMSMFPVCKLP